MELYLLHGNGQTAISKKLSDIKSGFDREAVTEISGKDYSFDQAIAELSTPSLFSEKRLAILEQLNEVDLSLFPNDPDLTVVIRFSKLLPSNSKILKQAQSLKAQIFQFTEQEEANIFPLIDFLADKNPRALQEVDYRIEEHGGQYILTMIFYMLRRMVQDSNKLPGFVRARIEKQKKNFSLEKINYLYKFALETDFKIKSGKIDEKLGLTLLFEKIINI